MKTKSDISTIFFLLLIIFFIIEIISSILLSFLPSVTAKKYNRITSPFCVFENTPQFRYSTIKNNSEEQDVKINSYGFIFPDSLELKKNKKCIRIFVVGGSAAFGSGQSEPYNKIKKYPQGLYSYESGICGQLSKCLQENFPEYKFQVINACSSGRKIHQSLNLYISSIRFFNPDIIISFDGQNDLSTIAGNNPYFEDKIYTFPKYLSLETDLQNRFFANFFKTKKLIDYLSLYYSKWKSEKTRKKLAQRLLNYDYSNYSKDDYLKIKTSLVTTINQFTDLIVMFNELCKINNTDFVFVFQPMLYRQINKKLTTTESKMRNQINPINKSLSSPEIKPDSLKKMEHYGNIVLKYFFDDYLSNKVDSLSLINEFYFIDINKQIADKYHNFEFYTDYCHLTFDGHRICAEIIFEKIRPLIENKIKN